MQKNRVLIAVILLVLGIGIGYLIGGSQTHPGTQSELMMPTTATSGMHATTPDAMVQELETKSGSERDEAFIENMIVHHQSAVAMSEILLTSTRRPELKQLAKDIIAAQTKEIGFLQAWLKEWYGR